MAEESEKGTSSWFNVPTWDGDPTKFRDFKKEMSWWLASLEPTQCAKYNVAARWTLRQSGTVRARCEEFEPDDLLGVPPVSATDPSSGEIVVIEAGDPFAGIKKLMKALEESMGKTELDRKGELRKQFYQVIRRSPGERVATFCTRFRTLTAELRREGITLPSSELGWFLKDRLGLDSIRRQLLETALGTRETYDEVEVEVLRLFRDLHEQDPLHGERQKFGDRAPILQRFLQGSQHGHSGPSRHGAPSSSMSTATSRSFRSLPSSSAASSTRSGPPVRRPFQPAPRQAYVAEGPVEEEDAPDDEDETFENEAEPEDHEAQVTTSLEAVLQNEAEVLATELQDLEEAGMLDPETVDSLEEGVEKAAESLITMREARNRINEIKRDRGFGKAPNAQVSPAAKKMHGNQVAAKKSRTTCWDCGESGHWAGDQSCRKPGQGLFKPKPTAKKSAARHVKFTETLSTEHEAESQPVDNEVLMASSLPYGPTLGAALEGTQEVAVASNTGLAADKSLVGALDSACNRTCSGSLWISQFLGFLQDAPQHVRDLIAVRDESEVFRFGNGGTQISNLRYRIPLMVGDTMLLLWVSVVPVDSLGLLLGRDFLDAIGATLNFPHKLLNAGHLDGQTIQLKQLAAGHFALPLLPSPKLWPSRGAHKWRCFGQDGVVEVQMSNQAWIQQRLSGNPHLSF